MQGKALYETATLIDPETALPNVSEPLKLAFTWRDGAANTLPLPYTAQGKFSSYDGSGFVYDLTNLTTQNLVNSFAYLQENTWLDRETRCLFISLVTYNANFNLCGYIEIWEHMAWIG